MLNWSYSFSSFFQFSSVQFIDLPDDKRIYMINNVSLQDYAKKENYANSFFLVKNLDCLRVWHPDNTYTFIPDSMKEGQGHTMPLSPALPEDPTLHPNYLLHWRGLLGGYSNWELPWLHQSPAPCHSYGGIPQWLSNLRRLGWAKPIQECERILAEAGQNREKAKILAQYKREI